MRNSLSVIYDYVNKHAYPILLALFVIWVLVGVFPLQCYETDGQVITFGCDVTYREGWSLPPLYTYEYRQQPLITILITALKHVLPFFTCEQIYYVFTVLCSFAFLIGCVEFGQRIVKTSRTRLLIAAMLLPEMYAIAMYSNSAIPAAALMIWALILTMKQKHWQSVLLLCLATWFRIDIVTVYPVILPLLYFNGRSFKQSFWLAAAYALAIIVISLSGFWLMNAQVLGTVGLYEKWNNIVTPMQRFFAIFGYYSLTYFILLPLGIFAITRSKRWKELFVVLLPIVVLHIVMAEFGNASKHFLYDAPFAIIAGVRALQWLEDVLSRRCFLKWACIILAILLMTVSVRQQRRDVTWLQANPLNSIGIALPLTSIEIGGREVSLALGAGPQIFTGDEMMLATGHFFYSWYIHSIKAVLKDWRIQQKAVLDTIPTSNILTFEYGASAPSAMEYMTEHYRFCYEKEKPWRYEFTVYNPERRLHYWRVYLTEVEQYNEKFVSYIDTLSSVIPKNEEGYVLTAPEHFGFARFLDEIAKTGKVEKKADNLYKIIRK